MAKNSTKTTQGVNWKGIVLEFGIDRTKMAIMLGMSKANFSRKFNEVSTYRFSETELNKIKKYLEGLKKCLCGQIVTLLWCKVTLSSYL